MSFKVSDLIDLDKIPMKIIFTDNTRVARINEIKPKNFVVPRLKIIQNKIDE